MPCTFTLTENGTVLIAKVTGPIDGRAVLDYNKEAHEFALKQGIRRFLIDVTEFKNKASSLDLYHFAYDEMKQLSDLRFKMHVAILTASGDHSYDFLETVLLNTGHKVKLFTERNEAMKYLKESPD